MILKWSKIYLIFWLKYHLTFSFNSQNCRIHSKIFFSSISNHFENHSKKWKMRFRKLNFDQKLRKWFQKSSLTWTQNEIHQRLTIVQFRDDFQTILCFLMRKSCLLFIYKLWVINKIDRKKKHWKKIIQHTMTIFIASNHSHFHVFINNKIITQNLIYCI